MAKLKEEYRQQSPLRFVQIDAAQLRDFLSGIDPKYSVEVSDRLLKYENAEEFLRRVDSAKPPISISIQTELIQSAHLTLDRSGSYAHCWGLDPSTIEHYEKCKALIERNRTVFSDLLPYSSVLSMAGLPLSAVGYFQQIKSTLNVGIAFCIIGALIEVYKHLRTPVSATPSSLAKLVRGGRDMWIATSGAVVGALATKILDWLLR